MLHGPHSRRERRTKIFSPLRRTFVSDLLPHREVRSDDMWAQQYDQQPNQIECTLAQRPWTTNGPESNLYGLEPNFDEFNCLSLKMERNSRSRSVGQIRKGQPVPRTLNVNSRQDLSYGSAIRLAGKRRGESYLRRESCHYHPSRGS